MHVNFNNNAWWFKGKTALHVAGEKEYLGKKQCEQ